MSAKANSSKSSMQTTVYGKWILAGEHAVLRGAPAVVFPVYSRMLTLKYTRAESKTSQEQEQLSVEFSGQHGDELRLLFWGVIEKALQMTARSRSEAAGHFEIFSSIPVGAGMGASAALCVGIGRWCEWNQWVTTEELPEFCRQLENLFHGESSGVDIAVAISGQGLHYEREGSRHLLRTGWQPKWYLSYSGKRGVTSECVAKVKSLWQQDPTLAALIDQDMCEASVRSESAVQSKDAEQGFAELVSAIHKARSCFDRWGLAGGEMGSHLKFLMDKGAAAVKPTGSGDGGFVLSLWKSGPPEELRDQLISLNPE